MDYPHNRIDRLTRIAVLARILDDEIATLDREGLGGSGVIPLIHILLDPMSAHKALFEIIRQLHERHLSGQGSQLSELIAEITRLRSDNSQGRWPWQP